MGFRPEPRRYRLTFAEPDLAGLEVAVKSVSVRGYIALQQASDAQLIEAFAGALVSWNLEDPETGEPVPATPEGVQSADSNLITRVLNAWRQALVTVPPTSPAPSSNGASPMEQALAGSSTSLPS